MSSAIAANAPNTTYSYADNQRANEHVRPATKTGAWESSGSGMHWAPVMGGVTVALSVTLMLSVLGSALGLAGALPSSDTSLPEFGVKAAIWLIIMQWVSSCCGGYLTGRLRAQWAHMEADEVMFRDTAHGFVTWCVATLLMAMFISSATVSAVSGGAKIVAVLGGSATATAAVDTNQSHSNGSFSSSISTTNNDIVQLAYYVEGLFRKPQPLSTEQTVSTSLPDMRGEASGILMNAVRTGELPSQDKTYLTQSIAARTGISLAEAESRVDNAIAQINVAEAKIKQTAEQARQISIKTSIYSVLSMFVGAFIASAAAVLGGRHRDLI